MCLTIELINLKVNHRGLTWILIAAILKMWDFYEAFYYERPLCIV